MEHPAIRIERLQFPWQPMDPFLFCAYHHDRYPSGNSQRQVPYELLKDRAIGQDFSGKGGWSMYHGSQVPGFPYHPHRGFETISIVQQGVIDHSDSLGASGRFSAGDVQWMTAGKGVLHSEMFPLLQTEAQNPLEMFQIWLNLPKASKMVEPHFKMFWREDIPVISHADRMGKRSEIRLIAGEIGTHTPLPAPPDSWAANSRNGVRIYLLDMEPGASWTIPASKNGAHRSLAFYKGNQAQIGDKTLPALNVASISSPESVELVNGDTAASFLMLEGRAIREPVVAHGPFVMNSKSEILEAFEDYRRTQFGGWPWPEQEQVHAADLPRFARHADGREELPQSGKDS